MIVKMLDFGLVIHSDNITWQYCFNVDCSHYLLCCLGRCCDGTKSLTVFVGLWCVISRSWFEFWMMMKWKEVNGRVWCRHKQILQDDKSKLVASWKVSKIVWYLEVDCRANPAKTLDNQGKQKGQENRQNMFFPMGILIYQDVELHDLVILLQITLWFKS